MTTIGTSNVTITRLDRSKLTYSEQRGRPPTKGEILEKVVDGKLIKAHVDSFHHERPKVAGLGTWKIEATEI
jgi:hypothetical protein